MGAEWVEIGDRSSSLAAARTALRERRAEFIETSEGLTIVIPSKKSWLAALELGIFVSGFAFFLGLGIAIAVVILVQGGFDIPGPTDVLIMTVMVIALAVPSAHFAYHLAWILAGRELITVNSTRLTTRRAIWRFGKTKEFKSQRSANLRVLGPVFNNPFATLVGMSDGYGHLFEMGGLGAGSVAFDYGERTHRFGVGLQIDEATELVAVIKGYLQQER